MTPPLFESVRARLFIAAVVGTPVFAWLAGCSTAHDASASSSSGVSSSSSSASSAATSSVSSSTTSSSGAGGTDAGCEADEYCPPIDTTPITATTPETWQWVDLKESLCRDGSSTGIVVNFNPASNNLMIFLEGGGQCFSEATCAGNPSSFGATNAAGFAANEGAAPGTIFDRTLASNAVKDWNFVFVPYCTGDLHGGNNLNGSPIDEPGTIEKYVGYVDMQLALARLAATFPTPANVLLTGTSAGGAGVPITYLQTRAAFPTAAFFAIDDSGPPMSNTYLAPCLQMEWATLWRFDRTILPVCGAYCGDAAGQAIGLMKAILSQKPPSPFGVLDSTDDKTITHLYGYGANDCATLTSADPTPLTAQQFTAGLMDERAELASFPNFGSYVFTSTQHTSLGSPSYSNNNDDITVDGQPFTLTTWVADILAGNIANAGP